MDTEWDKFFNHLENAPESTTVFNMSLEELRAYVNDVCGPDKNPTITLNNYTYWNQETGEVGFLSDERITEIERAQERELLLKRLEYTLYGKGWDYIYKDPNFEPSLPQSELEEKRASQHFNEVIEQFYANVQKDSSIKAASERLRARLAVMKMKPKKLQ